MNNKTSNKNNESMFNYIYEMFTNNLFPKRKITEIHIRHIMKIREKDNSTLLHYICKKGDDKCLINVLNLFRKHISPLELTSYINSQDMHGETPMFISVLNGNNIIAGMLDLFGADKTIKNKENDHVIDSSSSSSVNNKLNHVINEVTKVSNVELANNSNVELANVNESVNKLITNIDTFISNLRRNEQMLGGATTKTKKEISKTSSKAKEKTSSKKKDKDAGKVKVSSKKKDKDVSKNEVKASSKKIEKEKPNKDKEINNKIDEKKSKSTLMHEKVLSMIRDLGYSDEESKIIKAGLYRYTKENHPELNNYERAVKMKDYVTLKHIKNIDIEAMKNAIKIHKDTKQSTEP